MNKEQSYIWGIFCSFFSAFIWGTSHISGRWLMSNHYIDVISLASIRYSSGGLLLLACGLLFHRKKILAVTIRDLLIISWLGFLGMSAHTSLLLIGQENTSAINTSLILSLNPIIAMFIGLFLGHKVGAAQGAGMMLSLLGSLMVIGIISEHGFSCKTMNFYGDLMTFAGTVCWSLYLVFSTRIVTRLGGFTVTAWSMLAAAVQLLLLFSFMPVKFHIPAGGEYTQWLVILYVVLFPTVAAFYFWHEAMGRIKLSLLNIMQYLTPIATIVLSYLILGERMSIFNIIGAALTLFGVMIAADIIRIPRQKSFKISRLNS